MTAVLGSGADTDIARMKAIIVDMKQESTNSEVKINLNSFYIFLFYLLIYFFLFYFIFFYFCTWKKKEEEKEEDATLNY